MKLWSASIFFCSFVTFAFADGTRSISYTKKFETDKIASAQNWIDANNFQKQANLEIDYERRFPGFLLNVEREGYVNVWLAAIFSVSAFEPQIKPLFDACVRSTREEIYLELEQPPTVVDQAKKQLTKSKRDKEVFLAIAGTLGTVYSSSEILCGVAPFQFLVALGLVDPFESPGLREIPSISKDWRIDPDKRRQYVTSLNGLYDRVLVATRDLTPEAIELLKLVMQVYPTERSAFLVNLSNKLKKQDLESLSAWAANLNSRLTGEDPRKIQDVMKADPNIKGLFTVMNALAAGQLDAYTQLTVVHELIKEDGFTLQEWRTALEFAHYYQSGGYPQSPSTRFKDLAPTYQIGEPLKVLKNYGCKVKESTLKREGTELPFGYLDCRK